MGCGRAARAGAPKNRAFRQPGMPSRVVAIVLQRMIQVDLYAAYIRVRPTLGPTVRRLEIARATSCEILSPEDSHGQCDKTECDHQPDQEGRPGEWSNQHVGLRIKVRHVPTAHDVVPAEMQPPE
jgi:hypothetical protein